MKRASFVLAALAMFAATSVLSGHNAPPKKTSELMKMKLKHAQNVLEGLALKDFAKINKGAEELLLISNEVEWKVLKTRDYENYSNAFRRDARALMKNAKEENLDACALSYVEMTLSCVQCHKHVREVRSSRLPRERGLAEGTP